MKAGKARSVDRSVRLWPGVLFVTLQWLLRFAVPALAPDAYVNEAMILGVFAALFGGVAVVLWWAFFSRVPHRERWGGLVLLVAALLLTPRVLHESIATGMEGMMFTLYALPGLCLALVGWAALSRRMTAARRPVALVAAILVASLVWALVRTGGFTGDLDHDWAWRWAPTPEERLVADSADETLAPSPAPAAAVSEVAWPGFRGPGRDGVVADLSIAREWDDAPPAQLWRRPVGPGWSSFAVDGGRFFTQEQRGEEEVVSCHDLATGRPVWRHTDPARFWESNAGAGPRGTPTFHEGTVYTLGATGIVNALAATDGTRRWSRDGAADTGAELPGWGFSSSPLVVDDLVVVAVAGALIAYERATGEPRWLHASDSDGYSSPQLFTLAGVRQILLVNGDGASAYDPADGTVLWRHDWAGTPVVQPARLPDGDLLISVSDRTGVRRLSVQREGETWNVAERWTSIRLKPFYADLVVHDGHAYGFDGSLLSCIDLEQGERQWKGGRYGRGQLVLLADSGQLLVLSEAGEVALVDASPEAFTERARFQAIESKTWNHPVVAGDVLLVRNAQEMAAYRLPLASE